MPSEADKQELIRKLTALVAKTYGGTGTEAWLRAFTAYDADRDGKINADELSALLSAAGIGNFFTLPTWSQEVIAAVDTTGDKRIAFPELAAVLVQAPPAPRDPVLPRPAGAAPYTSPPTTADVNIRNPSIKRLHFAIGSMVALHPESVAAQQLWARWLDFLHSDLYRVTPDASLFPFYKAFSQGYHVVWNLVGDPRPTITPDISVVTLLAEDTLESMELFERALRKTYKLVRDGIGEVTSTLLLPAAVILGIWFLLRR